MNFLIFLLSTDYILSHSSICLGLPTSTSFGVLPSGGIVVEPYLSVLAADCPFLAFPKSLIWGITGLTLRI